MARAVKRFAASVTIILDIMRARQVVVNAYAIPAGREIIVLNVSLLSKSFRFMINEREKNTFSYFCNWKCSCFGKGLWILTD